MKIRPSWLLVALIIFATGGVVGWWLWAGLPRASDSGTLAATATTDTTTNKAVTALEPEVPATERAFVAGASVAGREISGYEFGSGHTTVLIFGAFHGDEPQSAEVAMSLVEYLRSHPESVRGIRAVIIPRTNPDGLARRTRGNGRGVDINRNFPTDSWTPKAQDARHRPGKVPASEPETRMVMDLIAKYRPARIISIHAPMRCVNWDGPAESLAITMARANAYPLRADIGYATPGSFGTYAGKLKQIPTITLELGHGAADRLWEENKEALLAGIRFEAEPTSQKLPAADNSWVPSRSAQRMLQRHECVVEVDKSQNRLAILRRDQPATTFPVSTGVSGCTPEGTFYVTEKRANVLLDDGKGGYVVRKHVLASDLGDFWMGLNKRHRRTGRQFGIHGTDQPQSIGKQNSKGCVRMSNRDAWTVYKAVRVGTPVVIRPKPEQAE